MDATAIPAPAPGKSPLTTTPPCEHLDEASRALGVRPGNCWYTGRTVTHSTTAVGAALVLSLFLPAGCGEVSGDPDARPSDPAEAFCSDYGQVCEFDNDLGGTPYASTADCLTRFAAYNTVQRECVTEHMSFAVAGDPNTNCPRAEGGAPCDPDSTFCAQYDLICGFANDHGGDPFASAADCAARYAQFDAARQTCVQQHLGFAESDPSIHCPHVAGAPPCD
jgi:hypothetical protein